MASVLKRRGRIQVRLDERERTAILDILERLQAHLSRALATTPRAYEDDTKQAEYDRWVRPEIERGYEADLDVIRDALSSGDELLVLTEAQVLAWLRAFNQLRLAAGSLLAITEDGWETAATDELRAQPEFGMLMALGWLQEELVAALES
ncbi:MAG: DUF2017 domain-containing protein [Candidatus Dormibacteraeota bacterium]|nr:DUF2017 domain-containing protein [Candidatus Dormibacteraeota bacterium]